MRAVALGVALAWGMLGVAGIALSVMKIARLPSAELGDAIRVSILLAVLIVGASGAWAAMRERWPAIRELPAPPNWLPLGWSVLVVGSVLGFAIAAAVMHEISRQQVAGPLHLGAACAVSAAAMFGAWARYRNFEIGRILLKILAVIAIMACVALLVFSGPRLHAAWLGSAVAVLVLGVATLWLSRHSNAAAAT